MKVIVAAAGTGGHINPGIAIANKIKKEDPNSEIIFIGTSRGMENDLVPKAGYELKIIDAYGFDRKINIKNIKKALKTLKGFRQARRIVKEFKPDIVVGTGGYICAAVCLASTKYKIPTFLHESNAYPGIVVKMLSKRVDKVLLGFDDAKDNLSKAKKVVVTGTPTKIKKINLNDLEKQRIKKDLGFQKELPLLLVFGGSQGAKSINDSFIEIFDKKLNKEYQIIYATGPKQYGLLKEQLKTREIDIENIENTKIVPYIYNMEEVMNVCDMLVCRSGAMTITEVSIVGKPAIFIPLPHATENHQEYNAKVLEKIGAAKIILNKDLNAKVLSKEINKIILDKEKIESMGKLAKTMEIKNVEERIYDEIKKVCK